MLGLCFVRAKGLFQLDGQILLLKLSFQLCSKGSFVSALKYVVFNQLLSQGRTAASVIIGQYAYCGTKNERISMPLCSQKRNPQWQRRHQLSPGKLFVSGCLTVGTFHNQSISQITCAVIYLGGKAAGAEAVGIHFGALSIMPFTMPKPALTLVTAIRVQKINNIRENKTGLSSFIFLGFGTDSPQIPLCGLSAVIIRVHGKSSFTGTL